jgi:hypothetical protein
LILYVRRATPIPAQLSTTSSFPYCSLILLNVVSICFSLVTSAGKKAGFSNSILERTFTSDFSALILPSFD